MDKIKFIENEIHCVNFQITKINKDIAFLTENKRATTDLEKTIVVLTKRLQTLQQIKTDLEAWEVVKKYLFVDKNIFEEDWEEFEYEYIRFINENICPMHGSNFEEIDIIKKALEVGD